MVLFESVYYVIFMYIFTNLCVKNSRRMSTC